MPHSTRRSLAVVVSTLLLSACGKDISLTDPSGRDFASAPVHAISDAANSGGRSGFYFLPPIVRNPVVTGTFDGNLTPEVQICRLNAGACDGALLARFTTTTGPGSETVRVDMTSQLYIVNWN